MGELWTRCLPPAVSAGMGHACLLLPIPQTGLRQRNGAALPSVKPSQPSLGNGHCLLLMVRGPLLGPCASSPRVTFLYFSPVDWGVLERGSGVLNLGTQSGYSGSV